VRLCVDGDTCAGHGRCYTMAPNLLEDDAEGYVMIRGSSIEVPEDQVEEAREAAETCPELAITLVED
jgi:ferredoxin